MNPSNKWTQFGISLIVVLILPLLPSLCEFCADFDKDGNLNALPQILALTAATFVASVGLSSRYGFLIFTSFPVSAFFSFQYGMLSSGRTVHYSEAFGEKAACAVILFVVVTHLGERYVRHVMGNEDFLRL